MLRRTYDPTISRIGYDFYADVAERIVEVRKAKRLKQEDLSKITKLSLSKIARYETVGIRVRLPDLEKIAKACDVSVDHLVCAEYDDPDCLDCLYTVTNERFPDLSLYFKASSPQLAALKAYEWSIEARLIWFECRDRILVKLVGVPVRKSDYSNFRTRNGAEEDEIEK